MDTQNAVAALSLGQALLGFGESWHPLTNCIASGLSLHVASKLLERDILRFSPTRFQSDSKLCHVNTDITGARAGPGHGARQTY